MRSCSPTPVVVNTAFDHRPLDYDLGIGAGDDSEQAVRLILEFLRDTEGVPAEPAPVLLLDFAPSPVRLRVRCGMAEARRRPGRLRQGVTPVKNQSTSHGIALPIPTQPILFHDQTDAGDGDCARQCEGWPAGNTGVLASRNVAGAIRHLSGFKSREAEGE